MGDLQAFVQRAKELGSLVLQSISDGKSIIIVCNYDADGICAATLLAKAIQSKRGKVVVRVVPEANSDLLHQLKEDNYDLYLFCDVGAGLVSETKSTLGDKIIIEIIIPQAMMNFHRKTSSTHSSMVSMEEWMLPRRVWHIYLHVK